MTSELTAAIKAGCEAITPDEIGRICPYPDCDCGWPEPFVKHALAAPGLLSERVVEEARSEIMGMSDWEPRRGNLHVEVADALARAALTAALAAILEGVE